jgi:hypothetical protein
MSFPFAEVDIEEMSATMSSMFNVNTSDLEEEILKLQCDISLKARASEKNSGIYSMKNSTQAGDQ